LKGLNFGAKLVATSVLGGLASVAGGGKFANGAVTAAFGYLFNAEGGDGKGLFGDLFDDLGHEARKRAMVGWLRLNGYTVETEVRLWVGGVVARADIMYMAPESFSCGCQDAGFGRFGVIDIKTPKYLDWSTNQEYVYNGFNNGRAWSDASRIATFGFTPGQLLPAGWVIIANPTGPTVLPPRSLQWRW
jgi:hypothetical protein